MLNTIFKRISAVIAAAIVAALTVFIFPMNSTYAIAETKTPSDVLDDLQKDESFNQENYPVIGDDYSLKVIQIAESVDKQLFIYVYQPSDEIKDLTATAVNLSTDVPSDNLKVEKDFTYYTLSLVSTNGVFDKYLVEGLEVKASILRFYEIASIYRAFDDSIDKPTTDDNTTTEISESVGQLWTATTYNESVLYAMEYQETIKVESKHVGHIRYLDLKLFQNSTGTDSHYLAFSTDKPIDTLLEAKLLYSYQAHYKEENSLFSTNDKETVSKATTEKTLKNSEIFSKDSWFSDDYEYNRIQSIDEFLNSEKIEFSDETKTDLSDKAWVLRFHESSYFYKGYFTTSSDSFLQNYCNVWQYQTVSEVSILRLKYEYQGDIYNLGVVDNKQTPDEIPDETVTPDTKLDIDFGFMEEFLSEITTKVDSIGRVISIGLSLLISGGIIFFIATLIIKFLNLIFGGRRRG